MTNFLLASLTLLKREVVRFIRQRNRIVGALGTPIVFWVLIGSGFKNAFQGSAGAANDYLQYFFPGTIVLILLFTAIFSTISLIEDRREGFLQGVLVSPAPRSALVLGSLLGGTTLATAQGLLFFLAMPFVGVHISIVGFLYALSLIIVMSFGLTALGFLMAWRLDSTQGFHALMNLFLMPLWLLSGALFPVDSAPTWLKFVMKANPLTYSVAGLHQGFFPNGDGPSRLICFGITGASAVVLFLLALITVRQQENSI